MSGVRRIVTDEVVGELGRTVTRRGAEAILRRALVNAGQGPVEYRIERRGGRWAVVGYQAKLVRR